ncbi:MAG TPA: hypothetical protein VFK33_00305 [Bacillales bacterium]|nr:hypothetical protein [Bacillales bacterium]
MLKLHLFFVTLSISAERRRSPRFAQNYEDDLRIRRLVEDNQRKRDKYMPFWH